ncbi:MAG: Eco57I restriction-modification methylase domain-containing protein [Treponematales bacterium]
MPRDKALDPAFPALDTRIRDLAAEKKQRAALDKAILLANEALRIMGAPADALCEGEDALDRVIPASAFPNQKAETWFEKHPYMGGERVAITLFDDKNAAYESKFYALGSSATKARISAGVMLTPNWEDSDLTAKSAYKVGVDFFLPPRAASLLMVISRRGNLRVMELGERLTNTQHDIFKQIANVFAEAKQEAIHARLWNALELRELNEKFYCGIAEHFESLVKHLEKHGKESEDSKQFTARLLGRVLFVWFLRKKGMIAADSGYFDAGETGNDDNDIDAGAYYTARLEPLFFSRLNTPIQARSAVRALHATPQQIDRTTPCLNGGLFYDKPNDWLRREGDIPFPPDWFRSLYGHLERFNFTTDESSPQYEQVAIDPEMLGRVFESLLATQFTETGEQVRKSTGAFYTPREIVEYMCRESLRQHLYTALGDESLNAGVDKLLDGSDSSFVTAHTNARRDLWGESSAEAAAKRALAALKDVTILDPACGSGAFPMGMLQLLLKTYERLDPELQTFAAKTAAPADTYEIRRRAAKLFIIQNNLYGVDIEEMAVEIARLRAWLSIVVDEEDTRNVQPLPNLDFKFVRGNSLRKLDRNDLWNAVTIEQLEKLQDDFFKPSETADNKKGLLASINAILRRLTKDGVFDFCIWFSKAFKRGGFDVVIGNPPYVKVEHLSVPVKNQLLSDFVFSADLYEYFIHRGYSLIKQNGLLALITNDSFLGFKNTQKVRALFFENDLIEIVKCPAETFEADIYVAIFLCKKTKSQSQEYDTKEFVPSADNKHFDIISRGHVSYNFSKSLVHNRLVINSAMVQIFSKFSSLGRMSDICTVLDTGIHSGNCRDKVFFHDKTKNGLHKMLQGKQISRYSFDWNSPKAKYKYCNIDYIPQDIPGIGRGGRASKAKEYWHFCGDPANHLVAERVLLRQSDDDLIACYVNRKQDGLYYTDNTLHTVLPKQGYDLKYILALLNSRLLNEVYHFVSQEQGKAMAQVKTQVVESLPIPNASKKGQEKLAALVDKILAAKSADAKANTSETEAEVDRLVYGLYGLTEGEIAVVEGIND